MIRFAAWLWLAVLAFVAGFVVSGWAYFGTLLVTGIAGMEALDAHVALLGARLAKKQAELDTVIASHVAAHDRLGNTIHIYLPRECPYEVFDKLMDKVALEVLGTHREDWDPFVWSHAGICEKHGGEAECLHTDTNKEHSSEH